MKKSSPRSFILVTVISVLFASFCVARGWTGEAIWTLVYMGIANSILFVSWLVSDCSDQEAGVDKGGQGR